MIYGTQHSADLDYDEYRLNLQHCTTACAIIVIKYSPIRDVTVRGVRGCNSSKFEVEIANVFKISRISRNIRNLTALKYCQTIQTSHFTSEICHMYIYANDSFSTRLSHTYCVSRYHTRTFKCIEVQVQLATLSYLRAISGVSSSVFLFLL